MVVLLITASLEGQHLAKSFFNTGLLGAAGSSGDPVDDQFNRVSFLSHFEGSNNGVNNAFDDGSANNYTVTAAGNVTQGSFGPFARPDGDWGVDTSGGWTYWGWNSASTGALGDEDFCMECFVFINSFAAKQGIASRNSSGTSIGNETWRWEVQTNGTMTMISKNFFGQDAAGLTSSTALTLNTWHHIAAVRQNDTLTFYIDGTARGATSSGSGVFSASDSMWNIGSNGYETANSTPLQGLMSNFRLVVGSAVYTGNFTAPSSKLTAITNTEMLTYQSNRFVDNSADGNSLTTVSSPAISAFGPFLTSSVYDPAVNGASAYMDGSGDTLRATWTAANIINQNFTLEYWLYYTQTSGYGSVSIGANDNSASYTSLTYLASNGQVFSDDGQNSGSGPDVGAGAISPNSWNHLALVRVSNDMFIYINGVKKVTKAITASLFQGQSGEFGIGYIANPLKGYICDARVVTSAVYTGDTYTVPTAPLTAITNTKLLLNMADGQAIDSAAQNNLTLYGTAKTSTAQKLFGTASLLLDGNSDLATISSEAGNFGTGNFTIEFSFRLAANVGGTPNSCIAKWETSGSQRSWMVRIDNVSSANKIKFFDSADGSANSSTTFSTSFSSETWYKIAVVNVSGTVSLYVNGTADSTTHSLASGAPYASTGLVSIGANVPSSPDNFFNGNIDEVRLSKFARYTSNYTAPTKAFADKGQ